MSVGYDGAICVLLEMERFLLRKVEQMESDARANDRSDSKMWWEET